jgi:argininosuccinate lyase
MNIEAALTDSIGEAAKKLHTARSRNDQVLTDFRLWCRDAIDAILARIKHLQVSLVRLALKNEGLIVPGYTHLQRAQPVLLQHLLLAFVEQVCLRTTMHNARPFLVSLLENISSYLDNPFINYFSFYCSNP